MRAYLALGSFEGRSKLYSWLTRIAINSSLMALRKRRVRREASFEPLSCCEDEMPQLQIKISGGGNEDQYATCFLAEPHTAQGGSHNALP